jgi:hypothetical protein
MMADAIEKARRPVEGRAGVKETELRSRFREALDCEVKSKGVTMLEEDLYATVLEKHVNEWCLSLAEKTAFIQL